MTELHAPSGLETLDLIVGTKHDDTLSGGTGDDKVSGLGGDDVLSGAAGNDTLIGGAGNDTLKGGAGNDLLKGGAGFDYADYSNSTGVTLDFHHAVTDSGTDTLKGMDGAYMGGGDDVVTGTRWDNIVYDSGGHNVMDMGSGDDQVWLTGPGGSSIEGGDGNDMLSGGDGADTLLGGVGNDTLIGGAGDDLLTADYGQSSLDGGAGNDTLSGSNYESSNQVTMNGGGGDDTLMMQGYGYSYSLDGGDGYDTVKAQNANSAIYLNLNNGSFNSIEAIVGSDNMSDGDQLWGWQHASTYIDGGLGDDQLYGGDLADTLVGGGGQGTWGYSRDDFWGGGGADTIIGGNAYDVFHYEALRDSTPDAPDLIEDFQDTNGVWLADIDADTTKAGDQAFVLVHHLTHHAGQLAVSYDAASDLTSFAGDVDGDGHADLLIEVQGDHSHYDGFFL